MSITERRAFRSVFTKRVTSLNELIESNEDKVTILSTFKTIEELHFRLQTLNESILKQITDSENASEDDVEKEVTTALEYSYKYNELSLKIQELQKQGLDDSISNLGSNVSTTKIRLPKIELKKFDGDLRNWIGFWSQFCKINCDDNLNEEDKFEYLLQSLKPDSPAQKLIEGFPPSKENYTKAIDLLKSRFGKDELLIEYYVRELLTLVIKREENFSVTYLYDKLEVQLRALHSLSVTKDKYAAILFPLVESAIPEPIFKVWERHRVGINASTKEPDSCLSQLLEFLKTEVEAEERLKLRSNKFEMFGENVKQASKPPRLVKQKINLPSAATLVSASNHEPHKTCIFCKKSGHSTQDCTEFQRLSLSERNDHITKKGCCFACLRPGHTIKSCKVFVKCLFCGKKHYGIMCRDLDAKKTENHKSKQEAGSHQTKSEVLSNFESCAQETLLQTLLVNVQEENGKEWLARVLLDTGSQRSYVTKDCVQKLGLQEIGKEDIDHSLFGGVNVHTSHKTYLITLKNVNNHFQYSVPVLDQDTICTYVPRLSDNKCLSALKEKNIILTDVGKDVPDVKVLLGSDVLGDLYTGVSEKLHNGLVAVETHLGWTIMGKQYTSSKNQNALVSLFCHKRLDISDLWSLESIGIKDPTEMKTKDHLAAEALKHFNENVKLNEENRYEVQLPWIEGHPELLNNHEVAEKRLLSTTRKLQSLKRFEDYNNVFKDWLSDGIIEEVPETSEATSGYYLPHHAVIKEKSSTTKIRPVFDASSKDKRGNSLNSCLEKGPNLIEAIPSLLMKFRLREIGVTGDIKKAFLQISLSSKDRDYVKFLWWSDYGARKIISYRHCRVVFGISSSPFLLNATINHHLVNVAPELREAAERLKHSFYVDNCIASVDSAHDLKNFIEESCNLMLQGQFELREWASNIVPEDEELKHILIKERTVPVLGMLWDTKKDELFCDLSSITAPIGKLTKRSLLSVTQKLFDVIGFTCPVSLVPKLLLQEVWREKLTWDEELPDEIAENFIKWFDNIHWLDQCRIPRRMSFLKTAISDTSIHVFCDASKLAYASCVFLRRESEGQVDVMFICAKSRITPPKPITIPRLELLATLIGSRLYTQVKEVVEHSRVFFWTDSTTALTWINMKEDWSTFVGNRCKEICQNTNKGDWRYVPGHMNPADLPSRGCSGKVLFESKWWEGPQWLKGHEDSWPRENIELDEEAFAEKKKTVISAVSATDRAHEFSKNLLYFSKYSKLLRMMAWILRFLNNIRASKKSKGQLTMKEINEAEMTVIKLIQTESLTDRTTLKDFPVFPDENGILRLKTRLTLCDGHEEFKFPIILPSHHPIVTMLVTEKHIQNQHVGTQTLLSILRERFWIIRGRKTLRTVLSKCVKCKRFNTQAGKSPPAPLPLERITCSDAFQTTGIDLAGPLFLKNGNKSWIVLFTCAVYRAVHLELIESLSTEAFIAALRRFISRRGRVSTICTDNGTNFIGTHNKMKQLNWNEITNKFNIEKIEWRFNPPSSPWWGGWWERLIRMIKELLRRNLGLASLAYEELMTVLCECEAIINSRPLTYISDSFETLQPLTPSMFLQPNINIQVDDLNQIDSKSLNRRVRYILKIRECLKSRFQKEYLSLLVNRSKEKSPKSTSIKVGDVVLIGEDNVKRIKWPLAVVLKMYNGRDGVSRVAKLKTASGELIRPVQRLYSLEISADQIQNCDSEKSDTKRRRLKPEIVGQSGDLTNTPKETRSGRRVLKPQKMNL